MRSNFSNALVFSSHGELQNRVFEDYCNGIKANCQNYHYIDYINLYLEKGKSGFESHIEQVIFEKKIDCIFFIWWSCDLTFDVNFLKKLSVKTPLIMNFFDTEYFFEPVDRYYAQIADLVILPDTLARHRYEHLNIKAHTSFAMFDGDHYRKQDSGSKDIDVSFVGNLKQANRAEYVEYLRANGIKVTTYGVGSDNGFASFDEMVSIFNRSKINLNFTATSNSSNYIIPLPKINQRIKQSKGRPIEIALCGGFILSEYAPGIEDMFKIGEEMDVFKSKEELLEKIKYYLANDNKREAMATAGYNFSRSEYEVKYGFKKIFSILKQGSNPAPYPLYLDKEFTRIYSSSRFFYIAGYLLTARFKPIMEELCVIFKARRLSFSMAYFFSIKGVMFICRRYPEIDNRLKAIKNKLGIKVKY